MLLLQDGGITGAVNNVNKMDTVQCNNSEINFHFTQIVPTDSSFLDPSTC